MDYGRWEAGGGRWNTVEVVVEENGGQATRSERGGEGRAWESWGRGGASRLLVLSAHSMPGIGVALCMRNMYDIRNGHRYLWCFCARVGFSRRLKIALKAPLKGLPLFGWAMQASFVPLFLE